MGDSRSRRLTFRPTYAYISGLLFAVLVIIAACFEDKIIRPIGGDFVVVIFLYFLVRTFSWFSMAATAISVWLFAVVVEFSQYVHLIEWLGLEHSTTAKLILGHSFSWVDIMAYTIGVLIAWVIDKYMLS